MLIRNVRYKCIDSNGNIATFTVNEKGEQNSDSFDSYHDLLTWALLPENHVFLSEMRACYKTLPA